MGPQTVGYSYKKKPRRPKSYGQMLNHKTSVGFQPSSFGYQTRPTSASDLYPPLSYAQPSHHCKTKDSLVRVEVCTPGLEKKCNFVQVEGVQVREEKSCVQVARTVCTQDKETMTVRLCTVEYSSSTIETEATLVEINYSEECRSQMVTVCHPVASHPEYGHHEGLQKCEEIKQETCYNMPQVVPVQRKVEVRVPKPEVVCEQRQVTVPTVSCTQVLEDRCISLPVVEPSIEEVEQCSVVIGKPNCSQIELRLPLQVCQEQLYVEAQKSVVSYAGV